MAELASVPGPIDDAPEKPAETLADAVLTRLTPFSAAEFEAARAPWPHVWTDGERGLFPVGEVSIVAAPGREGKTYAVTSLSSALAIGLRVGGLEPIESRTTIIFSSEDDRRQYARKIEAKVEGIGQEKAALVRERIIVPDLLDNDLRDMRRVVKVIDREPTEGRLVAAIIEAVQRLAPELASAVGMLVFETAATLSEAEEDNRGFGVLIESLRRVARELGVAVVLVHHTSQAAAAHLADLSVSTADIRGGTALAFNSRQNLMLVNLGSEDEPFPETDARTVLRRMMAPDAGGRVAILIPLDTSKAADPAPIVFHWRGTACGPSLSIVPAPPALASMPWRALQGIIRSERAEQKAAARSDAQADTVDQVVRIVARIHADGGQPTARAVSGEADRSPTWATPYLRKAVRAGLLTVRAEKVPRAPGTPEVYRPAANTTEGGR